VLFFKAFSEVLIKIKNMKTKPSNSEINNKNTLPRPNKVITKQDEKKNDLKSRLNLEFVKKTLAKK
jgi:hypothetical protein